MGGLGLRRRLNNMKIEHMCHVNGGESHQTVSLVGTEEKIGMVWRTERVLLGFSIYEAIENLKAIIQELEEKSQKS